MDKHARAQSERDLPQSLRWASKRSRCHSTSSKRGTQRLVRVIGKPIGGRKGFDKDRVHRLMRRKTIETED